MSNRFRSIALALRPYVGGVYDLLEAADAVVALDGEVVDERPPSSLDLPHDLLVAAALGSEAVMQGVRNGKKIDAIRALRALGNRPGGGVSTIGLRAAKEAVEDGRVWSTYTELLDDQWRTNDEPPF